MTDLMKEKILDGIEDKYLSEAMDYVKKHNVKNPKWIRMLGKAAACLVIIMGLSVSSLSIAVAAGNMAAYNVLYSIYPPAFYQKVIIFYSFHFETYIS